jgi:hypothetical protein
MKNENPIAYQLSMSDKGRGELEAALCKLCQQDGVGEPLVRLGCSKRRWNEFVLALVNERKAKGKDDSTVVDALCKIDAGNASAARQKLEVLSIRFEMLDKDGDSIIAKEDSPAHLAKKGEPMWTTAISVGTHWERSGGAKASVSLDCLD